MTRIKVTPSREAVAAGGRRGGEPGLVSVVMATYNCRRFIGDAIRSVLAQTYRNLELHVVDDGSTDGTREEVAPFLQDSRVRYHYQANAGQTVAKNCGIRHSRGEFVAFCDADDAWLPDKLALQLPHFALDPRVGVVYSRVQLIDERGAPLDPRRYEEPTYHSGKVTAELFKNNFIPFGTAVVRRRCLDTVGGFNERYRMGIDWELWLRISLHDDFLFVDARTYRYRVWANQMSTNWKGRYDNQFAIMKEFAANHGDALDPAVLRVATAHSFATRARARVISSGAYSGGLADVVQALRVAPTLLLAWKTLGMMTLNAVGVRKSG